MTCFCKQEFYQNYRTSHVFEDGQKHCNDWFLLYSASQSLIYTVPLLISIVNMLSMNFMSWQASFKKPHSLSKEQIDSAFGQAWISFTNIGLLILLVNLKINYDLPVPIL